MSTRAAEQVALQKVQRRVAAIGFFSIAIHGVLGLIGVAYAIVDERRGDATVLLIMSVPVALVTYGVIRFILAKPPVSWPWLAVALTPSVAGSFWVLG